MMHCWGAIPALTSADAKLGRTRARAPLPLSSVICPFHYHCIVPVSSCNCGAIPAFAKPALNFGHHFADLVRIEPVYPRVQDALAKKMNTKPEANPSKPHVLNPLMHSALGARYA